MSLERLEIDDAKRVDPLLIRAVYWPRWIAGFFCFASLSNGVITSLGRYTRLMRPGLLCSGTSVANRHGRWKFRYGLRYSIQKVLNLARIFHRGDGMSSVFARYKLDCPSNMTFLSETGRQKHGHGEISGLAAWMTIRA
jgi:hypothetical protein